MLAFLSGVWARKKLVIKNNTKVCGESEQVFHYALLLPQEGMVIIMKLIDFQGLNCYYNSIISIANNFGIDYKLAFCNLWSETEFRYSEKEKAFVSCRILDNLNALGLSLIALNCTTPKETASSIAKLDKGAFLVVGMNAFHTPWNPNYGIFSGHHYFIAVKSASNQVLCYDPTYNKSQEEMLYDSFIEHANDIHYVYQCAKGNLPTENAKEIKTIAIESHSKCLQLLSWFEKCINGKRYDIERAAKYVDCMINNRYLYRHYLNHRSPEILSDLNIFDNDFFSRWTAVKNGLLKAAIVRNNRNVIEDVCTHTRRLMEEESNAAQKMID